MHEMGLAMHILRTVEEKAKGRTVRRLYLEIGAFSGVNADALIFCAESAFKYNGAGLDVVFDVTLVPGRAACSCGLDYEITDLLEPCPACSGFDRKLIDGKDLTIVSMEVDNIEWCGNKNL